MHMSKMESIACVNNNIEFYGVNNLYDKLENICPTYLVTAHFSLLSKTKCDLYVT